MMRGSAAMLGGGGGLIAAAREEAEEVDREKWNSFNALVSPRIPPGEENVRAKGLAGRLVPRFPQAVVSKVWVRDWRVRHPDSVL